MTRDIIDINDFTILVETNSSTEVITDSCVFDEPVIAVAFYGSGNVHLNVNSKEAHHAYDHTKGLALSFFADGEVEFEHVISPEKPLESILIATAISNLDKLPEQEAELFSELLHQLVNPAGHYVAGPQFYMPPEMQSIVDQIFHSRYEGKAKMMFFKSQITSLLAHYFGQLSILEETSLPNKDRERLEKARQLLTANLNSPPSLTELSKEIGLNTFKLKKTFKEVFGVPVFKYLQNERLNTAHELIKTGQKSIQEAAWEVGYDSLSSFSNAFAGKFGFRPSEIKR